MNSLHFTVPEIAHGAVAVVVLAGLCIGLFCAVVIAKLLIQAIKMGLARFQTVARREFTRFTTSSDPAILEYDGSR